MTKQVNYCHNGTNATNTPMAPAECAIKYVSLGNRDYKYLIYGEANN
jgi:hypothetical protein